MDCLFRDLSRSTQLALRGKGEKNWRSDVCAHSREHAWWITNVEEMEMVVERMVEREDGPGRGLRQPYHTLPMLTLLMSGSAAASKRLNSRKM